MRNIFLCTMLGAIYGNMNISHTDRYRNTMQVYSTVVHCMLQGYGVLKNVGWALIRAWALITANTEYPYILFESLGHIEMSQPFDKPAVKHWLHGDPLEIEPGML